MTSHELALLLLEQPDIPVCINEYTGGDTPLREIEVVQPLNPDYAPMCILLQTRGPDFSY